MTPLEMLDRVWSDRKEILKPKHSYKLTGFSRKKHQGVWTKLELEFKTEEIEKLANYLFELSITESDDYIEFDEISVVQTSFGEVEDCGITAKQIIEAQNMPHDEGIVDGDMEDPGTAPWVEVK